MSKNLEDYKGDTGENFLDFWFFKCTFTKTAALATFMAWPFMSYMLSTMMIYPFSELLIPTLPACIFFFFVTSLACASLDYFTTKELNKFVDKIRSGEPVPYYSYKEYGHILHYVNYDGKVLIKSKDKPKEIEFN